MNSFLTAADLIRKDGGPNYFETEFLKNTGKKISILEMYMIEEALMLFALIINLRQSIITVMPNG